jgi:hypothetical protein
MMGMVRGEFCDFEEMSRLTMTRHEGANHHQKDTNHNNPLILKIKVQTLSSTTDIKSAHEG